MENVKLSLEIKDNSPYIKIEKGDSNILFEGDINQLETLLRIQNFKVIRLNKYFTNLCFYVAKHITNEKIDNLCSEYINGDSNLNLVEFLTEKLGKDFQLINETIL